MGALARALCGPLKRRAKGLRRQQEGGILAAPLLRCSPPSVWVACGLGVRPIAPQAAPRTLRGARAPSSVKRNRLVALEWPTSVGGSNQDGPSCGVRECRDGFWRTRSGQNSSSQSSEEAVGAPAMPTVASTPAAASSARVAAT